MNVNELMIGDWVVAEIQVDDTGKKPVYERFYKRVVSLDKTYIELEDGVSYGATIFPIPLTPEILEKNGFVRIEDDCGLELYSYCDGLRMVVTYISVNGCPYLTIEDVLDYDQANTVLNLKGEVYNVHELQHALRLCRIEKEVIL